MYLHKKHYRNVSSGSTLISAPIYHWHFVNLGYLLQVIMWKSKSNQGSQCPEVFQGTKVAYTVCIIGVVGLHAHQVPCDWMCRCPYYDQPKFAEKTETSFFLPLGSTTPQMGGWGMNYSAKSVSGQPILDLEALCCIIICREGHRNSALS